MRRSSWAVGLAVLAAACGSPSSGKPSPTAAPSEAPLAPPPPAPAPVAPLLTPTATVDPNPLHLPPRRVTLDAGRRLFAPSDQMLANARVGSALVLYAATALGLDGDDVIVEGRGGPSYKVHAAYVIPVPDEPRVRPNDAVITEHGGVLHHALVTKIKKDHTFVRFTDLDARAPEVALKHARFIRQVEGLAPGNYAAMRDGDVYRHVLLVSPFVEGGTKRWLALGFAGAILKADEAALRPIPIKWSPKVGATIWAASTGTMRKAIVTAADDPGRFTVKFERAGRPAVVGFGLVMQPLDGDEPARGKPTR